MRRTSTTIATRCSRITLPKTLRSSWWCEAMQLLREDQREALVLTEVAGFRVGEVATAQG